MRMNLLRTATAAVLAASIAGTALADEGKIPSGMPRLDHVFVIMMENHSFVQIQKNPAMPFINSLIDGKASVATNYFAVGHPSLTNYLEIVGGSNFGVLSDNPPDWHNTGCQPNIRSRLTNADNDGGNAPIALDPSGVICPIAGEGMDTATAAVDTWNETEPPIFTFLANIDGVQSLPSAKTVGKTIADQLARAGLSWKTYQENLPLAGADLVNNSNGTTDSRTTFDLTKPVSATNFPPLSNDSPCPATDTVLPCPAILQAYAVKHNPFAYFQSVQEGTLPHSSLHNMVAFDGSRGLYSDLATGEVPSLSYIVPNQCNDQHGRSNGDAFCQFDPGTVAFGALTDGTQIGLNPGLSAQADATMERIVESIKRSPAWERGNNAIVIVWDENDYSGFATPQAAGKPFPDQNTNRVVLTVETNNPFGQHVASKTPYNSFSLLKSLEGAFRVPCLNHACDNDVNVMSDLFSSSGRGGW
jgi:phosphatidylinositol-3-phosphatase